MKTPIFTGVSTAIITPFTDGKIDFKNLKKILDRQKSAGIEALTVCGTTGEASTLDFKEHISIVKFCVKNAGGMKIIAGAGSNSTASSMKLAKACCDVGADSILIVTPYYNKATQSGLIEHYVKIADKVSKPIIMYNVPSRTGVSFTSDTYYTLSQHENINGVKEASGNFGLFIDTLSKCGDNLNIWSGNDDIIVPMMSLGAQGVISVASNIIPAEINKITACCFNGDYKLASSLQIKYNGIIKALFSEVNPIPVKAAAEILDICNGELRLPLTKMSSEKQQLLTSQLKALNIV